MPKLNWDGDDFRNPQDSSGTVADTISRSGGLQQGYFHGSLTRGLLAYYPMKSGSGSTLIDSTALRTDGSINGASWVSGNIGDYALDFDGSSSYVNEMHGVPSGAFTLSCWARMDTWDNNSHIFGDNTDNNNHTGAYLEFNNTNSRIRFSIGNGSSWQNVYYSSVSAGNWYHIVGTFNGGSTSKLYVNGSEVGSNTSINYSNSTNATWAGREPHGNWSNWLDGQIEDIRIYDRKLSSPEIKALYNLSQPSKVSPGDTL